MPRYYCDYCDTYLTHDSPSVRKQHNAGYKHKANVRNYYQQFEEQQTQSLIDQRIKEHLGNAAAFQVGAAYAAAWQQQRPRPPILPIPPTAPLIPGRPPVLPRPMPGAPVYGSAPMPAPVSGAPPAPVSGAPPAPMSGALPTPMAPMSGAVPTPMAPMSGAGPAPMAPMSGAPAASIAPMPAGPLPGPPTMGAPTSLPGPPPPTLPGSDGPRAPGAPQQMYQAPPSSGSFGSPNVSAPPRYQNAGGNSALPPTSNADSYAYPQAPNGL